MNAWIRLELPRRVDAPKLNKRIVFLRRKILVVFVHISILYFYTLSGLRNVLR